MSINKPDSMEMILSRILLKGRMVSRQVTIKKHLDIYSKKSFPRKVPKDMIHKINKYKKN